MFYRVMFTLVARFQSNRIQYFIDVNYLSICESNRYLTIGDLAFAVARPIDVSRMLSDQRAI
jgi:hypothetical protein